MYSSSSSLSTSSFSDSSSSSISKSSLSSSSVSNSYSSSSSSSVSLSSKSSVTHSSLSSSSKSSSTSSSSSTEIMSSFSSSSSSSTEIKSSSSSSSSSTEIKSSSSTEIKSSSSSTEFMTSSDSSSSSSGIDIENEVIVSMACRDYGEGRIFIHTDRIGAYLTGHGNSNLIFWRKILEWTSKKNPNENIRIGLINNTQQDSFNQIKNISFIGIDNIKMSDMSFVNLSDYDCIYFVGLSLSISSTITLKIKEFVENGGGLIIEYPNISRQNINVLRDIENIMCHSADRLLFTNSYWTIDGGNHYIYYDPVEISFMSTLRQNDFSEEWTILMSNIPNVVITTTTGNENILDFNLSSGSEFVISFISSMQNGIVEIEEDVSSSSSSESSSFSSSESSVIGSSSSISSNSLSSVSGSLSSSSSSTSSFSTIDVVWDKYDNTIPNASNTISTNGRLARGVSGGDSGGVISPCVIKDGLIYKMWYSDAGETGIFYATSTDGLNWTKYNNASETSSDNVGHDGRIPLGQSGGDVEGVASPSVIKDGHIYKMWYSGYYDASSRWRIYYAYSYDGLTWIKYDNSIPGNSNVTGTNGRIPRGTSGGDSRGAKYPCVIKDGSLYRMWYSGEEGSNDNYRIYYAYSYDGLTWTKYDNSIPASSNKNCTNGRIAKGSGSGRGDSSEVYAPCVVKDGSLYKMWYSGYGYDSSRRIYCAISYDGFTWNKYDNTIPSGSDSYGTKGRIPTGTTNSGIGDRTHAHRCSVIIDNNIYKAWYTGYYSSYDIYCAEG